MMVFTSYLPLNRHFGEFWCSNRAKLRARAKPRVPRYVFNLVLLANRESLGQLRRISRATKKVLTRSHGRSLQLLYIVGGNQAKLDTRTESATR